MHKELKILHVSQASSGGVLNAMIQLANAQTLAGAEVTILLARRPDSPASSELREMFADSIKLIETKGGGMGPTAAAALFIEISRAISTLSPDVIHLHSSFAGAIGRLVAWINRRLLSTFYSPHGFSFLRQDIPWWKRRVFSLLECFFHSLGGSMILVSDSERQAARRSISTKRLHVLENGIDTAALPKKTIASKSFVVGSAGRVSYAKAPWRFASLADRLQERANFVWVGGGSTEEEEWLSSESVTKTGWLTEGSALTEIANFDLYVSTSLWEGMPIAVIQAQALGIPCVVSNCVGNVDVVQHGVTGFVYESETELANYVEQLLIDSELRMKFGVNARALAIPRFDSRRLGPESIRTYLLPNPT